VGLAALIGVLAAFSPRDLWEPDEPRYGRIAYDMERGGERLVPRWNGAFDAEKPPLVYWLMAASGRLAGEVGAVAARLPCALLAGLTVLLTAALARRWFGEPAIGATAALLYATSELVLWNSSRAGMDFPMTAFALLATWFATSLVARPSFATAIACGASLGMALLAKGPHAFYVPVGAVVGGCMAAGVPRRLLDPRWFVALVAALVVFGLWLVPALLLAEPGYAHRLLYQLAERVIGSDLPGADLPHSHRFGYLLLLLLACGLPWTPLWFVGLASAIRARRAPEDERFGLGAVAGGALLPLLLLDFAVSKRDVYLIPLLSPLAILAARTLHRAVAPRLTSALGFAVAPFVALLALAAALSPLAFPRIWPGMGERVAPGVLLAAATALVAAAGAVAAFRLRRDPVGAVRTGAVVLGVLWVATALGVLGHADSLKTWDEVVPVVRRAAGKDPFVTVFRDSAVVWAFRPDLVPEVRVEDAAVPETIERLFAPGAPRQVVAVRSRAWAEALVRFPSLADRVEVVWSGYVGRNAFHVLQPRRPVP
jgi:4-amino-4-deoxy-L-arabinose transferase-like glycosyltransferase